MKKKGLIAIMVVVAITIIGFWKRNWIRERIDGFRRKPVTSETDEEANQTDLGDPAVDESQPEMTEKEIREMAKKVGIKNWYNKGIEKLKKELKELEGTEG